MRILLIGTFLMFATLGVKSQVTLNLKMFIEGYYSGNGLMNNNGAGGCLYVTGNSSNPNDADTITVSLFEPQHLSLVETQKSILHTDGFLAVQFVQASLNNSYFIRIRHRSALETWSSVPVIMQSTTNYDFTDSVSKAFGNNMVNVGTLVQPHWALYNGDISDGNLFQLGVGYQDGIIEAQDYLDMLNALAVGLTGYNCQDLTGNGIVDSIDSLIMSRAVSAIRFIVTPNPIYIEEIENVTSISDAVKFVCLNGKIFVDGKLLNQKTYNIFNLNGQFINRIYTEDLKSNYHNLQDGIYFLRRE